MVAQHCTVFSWIGLIFYTAIMWRSLVRRNDPVYRIHQNFYRPRVYVSIMSSRFVIYFYFRLCWCQEVGRWLSPARLNHSYSLNGAQLVQWSAKRRQNCLVAIGRGARFPILYTPGWRLCRFYIPNPAFLYFCFTIFLFAKVSKTLYKKDPNDSAPSSYGPI